MKPSLPSQKKRSLFLLILFVSGMLNISIAAEEPIPDIVDYNQHVRPILSQTCFQCHGPDEEHREADLRLDTVEGAYAKTGEEQGVKPGSPEKSLIYQRMISNDPDMQMPPLDSDLHVSKRQIEIIKKWISQGAEYQDHWAFEPIVQPKVPEVERNNAIKNPIDNFILKTLESKNIKPSSEADRYTLIRRVYLDLIGLPPSVEDVDKFVKDKSPNAYEKVVDGLLENPHYGERWGKHWLDQARYADTDGYTVDAARSMWPYRDWVIKALNEDMPFDQFTIEQIAGDLLPNASRSQKVATGFHRNTLINREGGTDAEQFRNEIVMDRVNTTGSVWLGLTVGCAQCHTHKFDPLTHHEYYQLFAFFNQNQDVNNSAPTLMLATEKQQTNLDKLSANLKIASKKLKEYDKAKNESLSKDERNDGKPIEWKVLKKTTPISKWGSTFKTLKDHSLLASGKPTEWEEYQVTFESPVEKITAIRLECLTDPSLPKSGPGRAHNGNFILSELEIRTPKIRPLKFQHASADHSQKGYSILNAIDGKLNTGWAINVKKGSMNKKRTAQFVLASPLILQKKESTTISLKFRTPPGEYHLGRFRLSVTDEPFSKMSLPDAKREVLAKTVKKFTDQKKKLTKSIPTTMVMGEIDKPRKTHLLIRGDFLRHGDEVHANTPKFISTLDAEKAKAFNRIDLARWLVSKENPLTARVIMNRTWMRYFGEGIVSTENDFGMQGALPTHPKLLDWLAAEFMNQNWSMKKMHRLIVTSATYRQSSKIRPDLKEKDPNNKFLARQSRIRVDAEIVRDLALSASGLLSDKIGGKSVYPPQPEGVYAFTQRKMTWRTSKGEDRFRRGMYTFFMRSAPYPMLTTFDTPKFNTSCTRRNRSNTPLQSLTLSNDESIIEMAQAMGRELAANTKLAEIQKLKIAYRRCLSRTPTNSEIKELHQFVKNTKIDFEDHTEEAKQVAGKNTPENLSVAEVATWTSFVRLLFNLDEFITRE